MFLLSYGLIKPLFSYLGMFKLIITNLDWNDLINNIVCESWLL
jgi:hypothetical protein